jgi:hypothetical protein
MEPSFTFELWAAAGAGDTLLLILASFFGWKLRSIAGRGQLNAWWALEARAWETTRPCTKSSGGDKSLESQHQLALHDKGFAQFAALQSSIRSTIAAIKEWMIPALFWELGWAPMSLAAIFTKFANIEVTDLRRIG